MGTAINLALGTYPVAGRFYGRLPSHPPLTLQSWPKRRRSLGQRSRTHFDGFPNLPLLVSARLSDGPPQWRVLIGRRTSCVCYWTLGCRLESDLQTRFLRRQPTWLSQSRPRRGLVLISIKAWCRDGQQKVVLSLWEKTMISFVGSHFDILVLAAFGVFGCGLGYASIADAVARR